MSSSQIISSAPQTATAAGSCQADAWVVETAKPVNPLPPPSILSLYGKDSPLWKPYQDALQQRVSHFVLQLKRGSNGPAGGYAQPAATLAAAAAKTAAASSSSKGSTRASTSGQWGFLDDAHMSIEDKLFQFIKLAQKNTDDELDKKMKEYRDKYCEKSDDGGGLLGSVGDFLGSAFGGGLLKQALEEIGGLVFKAGASALGLAPLGSVLGSIGKNIGGWVGSHLSSALGISKSSSGSSSSSAKKESGTPDERLDMLEIQRLCDKQKQMFDCVSNILRVIHDTAMTAVGNIR